MNGARLLLRIALRNLSASFLNIVIGLIIFVGTLFFVAGGSLVRSVDASMSHSIIGSVAGDAQIYSAASADQPALFDNWNLPDLAAIPDFSKVRTALEQDPDVKALVPMGVGVATVASGNTADQALERLRKACEAGPRAQRAEIESLKAHVRGIVRVIRGDYAKLSVVTDRSAVDPQARRDLARADSDAFWSGFDADPFNHLEFLENRIASLIPDADMIYLHYVGTDLDAFAQSFDRMRIVDGTAVPKGRRGMLLSKFTYESMFKLKTAYRLDEIHEALTVQGRHIAKDAELQDWVRQNRTQTREILLQLDPLSARKAADLIRAATGSKAADLAGLLSDFFDTDDANFGARYRVFYAQLAPLLQLYRLKPGDSLTIGAYAKSGFHEEVNVKVYGTFEFKGLEKSDLAGSLSLMDLVTFRELYGYVTPENMAETRALESEAGAAAPSRADAEAQLFGGGSVFGQAAASKIDDKAQLREASGRAGSRAEDDRVYTPAQMDGGVCLEAAVILKDPSRLADKLARLRSLSDGRGLGLKVLDWQKAAGNIGQFVLAANLILFVATAIIFIVALVVINNAVVMATLQRIREIGTLRAIGAQRRFVLAMVLTETMALGLVFGTAGVLAGSGLIVWAGHVGIPASNTYLYFFFSGPRLYPTLSPVSLVGAFVVVLVVTCLSALYPALLATRVSPVQAMASED